MDHDPSPTPHHPPSMSLDGKPFDFRFLPRFPFGLRIVIDPNIPPSEILIEDSRGNPILRIVEVGPPENDE